jgi:hypothetical protein
MPLYAVSVLNQASKIYDGYREVKEGELLGDTESLIVYDLMELNGWTLQEKPLTCQEKLAVLTRFIRGLPVENRANAISIATAIETALNANDLELAIYLTNVARLSANADNTLIDVVLSILQKG